MGGRVLTDKKPTLYSKKSITFGEALKKERPTAFYTMIKPVGSQCNMACAYCYYLDKADLYNNRQQLMPPEILEQYIRQYIEGNEAPEVTFVWHGGEPLLAGIDYFRQAMVFQQKYAAEKTIVNTLQTNGLLINDDWADFFREHRFLVGISIDGPEEIHDAYRTDQGRHPTFGRVIRAIEQLMRRNVEFNTLSVVNALSEGRGREVYRFLKSIGSRYMQFLPAVEHTLVLQDGSERIVPPGTVGAQMARWSVSAQGYGEFLVDIFDDWIVADVGQYFVQLFDATLAQWYGAPPGVCTFSDSCGEALVVEHNGDVYSCDHFVYPSHKLGNIQETDLKTLFQSDRQFAFGLDKRNNLPRECRVCRYYFACRGECPKHRFDRSIDGEPHKNTLCNGFKLFFAHTAPYMKYMCGLLEAGRAPAEIMSWPYLTKHPGTF